MKNVALLTMIILWAIGMISINITLASQNYTTFLIMAVITQLIVLGIYISRFKSFESTWKVIGGFFALTALWVILNAASRLIK
jgi:hypothetical protein